MRLPSNDDLLASVDTLPIELLNLQFAGIDIFQSSCLVSHKPSEKLALLITTKLTLTATIPSYSPPSARAYTLVPQLGQKPWGYIMVPKRYSCFGLSIFSEAREWEDDIESDLDSIRAIMKCHIAFRSVNQDIAVDATDRTWTEKKALAHSVPSLSFSLSFPLSVLSSREEVRTIARIDGLVFYGRRELHCEANMTAMTTAII